MSGLVRGLRECISFQEKPKRRITVQYANEGMSTVVLSNKLTDSLEENEPISHELSIYFVTYY